MHVLGFVSIPPSNLEITWIIDRMKASNSGLRCAVFVSFFPLHHALDSEIFCGKSSKNSKDSEVNPSKSQFPSASVKRELRRSSGVISGLSHFTRKRFHKPLIE
jgi:hypothetical protein